MSRQDGAVVDAQNIVGVRTEQNNEVDNVPVVDTMAHAPGRSVEEYMRSLDSIDNGTGRVAQLGAGASSSGGLRHNPSETRWNYDVFLSFSGEDTRKTITDHLYHALIQAGIHTFRDDKKLPRGEEISPQLLKAIEGSRISVVVFSRNYASSRWCLDELVKIMECRQKTPHVVLPIFYDTDPSDVRKQTGSYAKAFDEHEKKFKEEMEKVNRWREALTHAANLSGWPLKDGYEGKFIKKVVKELAEHVAKHVAEHPVGISSKEMVRTHYVVPSDPLCLDHGRYNDQPFVSSASNDVILNDVQNMVRGRTEPVEEHDVENSGRLLQPGAGATSFRILEDNPSETRGALLLTGSTKLVGRAFEENKNKIWSWLMDDEVSAIGIYGMGGAGKTTMLKHINNELLQSPDISHHVYWVTVSRDFSVPKLQNKIAKRIQLSFSNEEEELEHRATELSQQLMKKQRWILILDDLWKSFDPHKVGIHTPLKGCKLLITTRSETVCREMDSTNNVRVNPLSNEEAWTLFMEVLGHDRPLSPQVEQVARDITRECAGLPLGIKTIAGTMKGVDGMHEWSNTLEELKQSKVPQDKVEDEVFRILRFSYTHLSNEALQECFLYCGLFPEDFEIHREDLIDYLIDEGLVKENSREAEINKGRTMLDRLERACLLERLHDGTSVKMHDLIRDMAIQILEENSRAIVKAGAQLKELPDAGEWSEKLTSVSLMHNQIEEICSRHSPRCPNLSTLLLCKNDRLRFIADSFFEHMHGLKVLDLSRTDIECLPKSVCDLVGLTSLLLRYCRRLSSVPSLKKLKALKRLDLSRAPLKKIPHGMKYLLNLRHLRMNGCGENKFPSGILPKLSRLQVFILEEWIFVDGTNVCTYAPVTVEGKEVGCLRKLESLECHFEGQSNYLEYLKSRDATQSLRKYKIVVGQFRGYLGQNLNSYRGSKLVGLGNLNINRDADFLVIFSNDIQKLICECIDAGSISDVLPLKYSLSSCNSIESSVLSCSAPLPQPSPSYNGIFSALKALCCYGCKSMKKLFPSVLLPNLINLECIYVDDCEKMEEIIGGTRSDERVMGKESISSEFKLPKLSELFLSNLPELKSICNAKLICDSLEVIDVLHCEKLKRIPICLPLLENGQPSPPASLKVIGISPEEWWESTVEWEHPNAKDVLRPFVQFEPTQRRSGI